MRSLCIACLLLGSYSLKAQDGCIEGFVLDSAGAGIFDTHVIGIGVGRLPGFDVPTDGDGHFRIDTIPAGNYRVITSDQPGDFRNLKFAGASVTQVAAPADGTCPSITLRAPVRARLRLIVTDLLTAAAVLPPGASFRLDSHSSWKGFANQQGELLVPPIEDLEVQVGALGYESSQPIKISSLNPGEVRELELRLRPAQTGCITGVVVDEPGAPVSGVNVQADLSDRGPRLGPYVPAVLTNQDGRFRFGLVQPGEYFIFTHAERLGYPVEQGNGKLNSLVVPPGAGCADTTVQLGPKAAKLQLSVVDAVTQKPLPYSGSASGAHPQGGWTIGLVANPMPLPALKTFEITVGATGYQRQTLTIPPLQPEETRQLTIELQPDGSAANRPDR